MDQVAPCPTPEPLHILRCVPQEVPQHDNEKEVGAKYLATGHNLDDMAQSVMMNFVRGDVERLARLGPHNIVQPGMIPRINPLRTLPEKESLLYAMLSAYPSTTAYALTGRPLSGMSTGTS